MKCLYRIALGCLCGFACHTAVFAQQPSATNTVTLVAVVDIPKVFDAHPRFKAGREAMQGDLAKLESEFAARQKRWLTRARN